MVNVLIGLLVVALLLYRQLQARQASERSGFRLALILGVIGVIDAAQAFQGHTVSGSAVGLIVLGMGVGAALGAVRAYTVHVWRDENGVAWRKGNWVTAALWIVAIGLHLLIDVAVDHTSGISGLGTSTLLLYLALSLGVQREIVRLRAAQLDAGQRAQSPTGQWPQSR